MVTRLTMLTVLTYVAQVRKGGVLMVRGRPCKVTAVSEFQNGKHGASKCHFVGQCLFTGDKKEELMSSGHSAEIPFVKKKELQAMKVARSHTGPDPHTHVSRATMQVVDEIDR